ncbi:MAG TPA: GNAT family N-acetyltransferase [Lacipirellulaceae bacterium]|nr:GNAT family N-acetyltransferase [Lacipirellulaceae bacterium]
MSVIHFRKQLVAPPVVSEVPGISVRMFAAPDDVEPWLALRTRATASLVPAVRPWSKGDFHTEMTSKPWWRADHTWLAIAGDLRVAGAVTLALREGASESVPVIHWLLVDPAYQRRGLARSLISRLELAAWNAGHREVQLETHANWNAAVAFYQSIGYAPLRDRSPR